MKALSLAEERELATHNGGYFDAWHPDEMAAEFERKLTREECQAYNKHLIAAVKSPKEAEHPAERWTWHVDSTERLLAFLKIKRGEPVPE